MRKEGTRDMKFQELINKYHDSLKGGKGDSKSPNDVDKKELYVGIFVEFEHTKDSMKAMEIAIDHLTEKPSYYSELINDGLVDEKEALNAYDKLFKNKDKMEITETYIKYNNKKYTTNGYLIKE